MWHTECKYNFAIANLYLVTKSQKLYHSYLYLYMDALKNNWSSHIVLQ